MMLNLSNKKHLSTGMKTKVWVSLLTAATLATSAFASGELVKTRIGDLSFTHSFETGYPTDATAKKLLWIKPG